MLVFKFHSEKDKAGSKQKVYMLSTYHETNIVDTGKTDKNGNLVCKPAILAGYNAHMGGVVKVY